MKLMFFQLFDKLFFQPKYNWCFGWNADLPVLIPTVYSRRGHEPHTRILSTVSNGEYKTDFTWKKDPLLITKTLASK